jgi:hypothetical protein
MLSQMDLAVPLCWYYWRVGDFLKSEFLLGQWHVGERHFGYVLGVAQKWTV